MKTEPEEQYLSVGQMGAHANPPVSNPRHWPGRAKTAHSEEYLSIAQLARRIPYKPKTIRNLMCQGVFLEGVHFTRLTGRPIFLWSRVEDLLREGLHGRTGKSRTQDQ